MLNELVVRCNECGVHNPAVNDKCWDCQISLTHRTRWRVGCATCDKTMDYVWADNAPVRKVDIHHDCTACGAQAFIDSVKKQQKERAILMANSQPIQQPTEGYSTR